MIPRRGILRDAIQARRQYVVMPLWGMYHGRGQDLVDAIAHLGDDVLLIQSGPMFADSVQWTDVGAN